MKVKFITCSGVNETTDIPALIALALEFPIAEFGVQISGEKCHYGSERFKWINDLARYAEQQHIMLNMAFHVNRSWAEGCGQNHVTHALRDLLDLRDYNGDAFSKRVQLNFKIGREKAPDEEKMTRFIQSIRPRRCILSHNSSNEELIHHLHNNGVVFDSLYDESFGEGIVPEQRKAPAYTYITQGYAGGISPGNVYQTMNDIYKNWLHSPNSAGVWIDAEGMLKGEDGHIDLEKCRVYLRNALNWRIEHWHDA
ncbi:MAG: hypothetical protein J6Y91_00240 [Alphaproteobacteria bacterium]|nr:hypothetical protein [Alphaproteobacteria bacterium]